MMHRDALDRYKRTLFALRKRLTGESNHLIEAIKEDINPSGNLSGVPIHLADAASDAIDADLHVLEAERETLEEIEAALARIEEGSYGTCRQCGAEIAEERLRAVPFTSQCIECARRPAGPNAREG